MAAGTGYTGLFQYLVGNGFLTRCLDRLFGQLVAQFASAPVLIQFDIFEMTQVTAGFADLEFLLIGFVLMAGDTGDLLTFNLLFLIKMRFVNESDFFGEFDFFGFEFIVRLAVTGGCHTAGIGNLGSRSNGIAAQRQEGKMPRWFGRDVTGLGYICGGCIWCSAR